MNNILQIILGTYFLLLFICLNEAVFVINCIYFIFVGKNASFLRVLRTRSLEEEYSVPQAKAEDIGP